jgi:hypothetical protein
MNKDTIVNLLKTNDKAVARAIVVLNERQTATEQASENTINHNGVGFTPADARMGTSMANFFIRNGYLSPKQIAYWRKPNVKGVPRICKYAGQLLDVAINKAKLERVQEKTQFADAEAIAEQRAFLQKMREMA